MTTRLKGIEGDPEYFDEEERELIDSLNAAIDAGKLQPSTDDAIAEKKAFWRQAVKNAEKRRAITLRLQARDIERLKAMARRKGLPYQTYIASLLHQAANGDLIERD